MVCTKKFLAPQYHLRFRARAQISAKRPLVQQTNAKQFTVNVLSMDSIKRGALCECTIYRYTLCGIDRGRALGGLVSGPFNNNAHCDRALCSATVTAATPAHSPILCNAHAADVFWVPKSAFTWHHI